MNILKNINNPPIFLKPFDKHTIRHVNEPEKSFISAVLITVAGACRVEINDLIGRSRLNKLVFARFIVMKILYDSGRYSLSQIGTVLGRDHSTVIYGIRTFEDLLPNIYELRMNYLEVKKILEQ